MSGAMRQMQQCGNQKMSVYKLLPVPSSATNRFCTYFCSQREVYPLGTEHIPLHSAVLH